LLSRIGPNDTLRLLDSADERLLWTLEGELPPGLVGFIDVDDTLREVGRLEANSNRRRSSARS